MDPISFTLFCLFVFQLFQGSAELVRTGGAFDAATDAVESGQDVVDMLPAHQLADALQVAVTSAKEEHLLDDVVLVGCHVDHLGTRASSLVHNVFGLHILSVLVAAKVQ